MIYYKFPFEKVPKDSRIVLYGAGNVGKAFYEQITDISHYEVVLWLDKNADGTLVKKPEEIRKLSTDDYDAVIIAVANETIANDIKKCLIDYEVPKNKIIHHINRRVDNNDFTLDRINFITFAQLSECIRESIYKLPSDIDLIVGVPRSGIIPAYMLALFLNKNVCSLTEFINNITPDKGERPIDESIKGGRKKVLIVDDSICSGNALSKTKKMFDNISGNYNFIYLSIFALEESKNFVDYYFKIIPLPRLFQWNYMNHAFLGKSCVDIDGVLCVDPTPEQNDDGEKYIDFCLNAKPLYIPSYEIHSLVTSRLEKFRPQTEEWLKKHNVKYKNLYMLDLPDAQTRRNLNLHGQFKAQIYSKLKDTVLFIESEPKQAKEIAELTNKPCICVSTDEYFEGKSDLLVIPYVEMSITTFCTLKCRDCGLFNANYYFDENKKPEFFDTETLKIDIENFLNAIDEIRTFRLIGGEPFLHHDWDKLAKLLLASDKVQVLEIITNGTRVLEKEKLDILKNNKTKIIISDYGELSVKKKELEDLLKQNRINYAIANCIDDGWWNPGDNKDRQRSFEELRKVFNSCHLAKKCKHILNGELFVCSRDAHAQNLGIFPKDFLSHTSLRNPDNLRERIKDIYNRSVINNCNYCDGTDNQNQRLTAAIQLSRGN